MKIALMMIAIFGFYSGIRAQDSTATAQRRNTIKFELTQPIYPSSYIFSFERVTKPHQSFCVTFGYEELPLFSDVSSTVRVKEDMNKTGFKAGVEYRFYLKKENKYGAPHGVYIGPYVSYHSFFNKKQIEVDVNGTQELGELRTDFRILNIGFELGYQFVINDRWTFDVVMIGPSVSNYSATLGIGGNFTFDKEDVENEVLLKLLDRFPMLDDLLTDKTISSDGKLDSWAAGWRYSFLIGYHFGRGKK